MLYLRVQRSQQTDGKNMEQLESTVDQFTLAPGEVLLGVVRNVMGARVEVEFCIHGEVMKAQAMTTISVDGRAKGRQVVISFVNGEHNNPIILGLVHSALYEMIDSYEAESIESSAQDREPAMPSTLPVLVDGDEVVIEAKKELQLRCGASSITLTKDGKILIKGKYLLNRASGVNRIIGGSVQVN